jgi:hypothetical protein
MPLGTALAATHPRKQRRRRFAAFRQWLVATSYGWEDFVKYSWRSLTLLAVVPAALLISSCSSSKNPASPSNVTDNAPIAVPDGMYGTYDTNSGAETLHWIPSSSPNVANYQVFIYSPSPQSTSSYAMLGQTSASQPWYVLPNPGPSGTWQLRLQAVDAHGNPSGLSSEYTLAQTQAIDPNGGDLKQHGRK